MSSPDVQGADHDVLSVSIVVYRSDPAQLSRTLSSLRDALSAQRRPSCSLYLIDNGGLPDVRETLDSLKNNGVKCTILSGQGNIGYGRGHNLAIEHISSRYHLVLNPDIDLAQDALDVALDTLETYPEIGLLTPRVDDYSGHMQYLCRRYPTVVDLLVRGFAPSRIRRIFAERLARYEMRDRIDEHEMLWDPPIASGCFMLFRTSKLRRIKGFDPRYFLYFEDYDLSLRMHDVARIAYVPTVRVRHYGGGAARKGFAHIRMFAASAFRFYNRFGWRWS
ncbi:glycosyl transferase [Burkholderia sp. WAC0059]|uniref:glycosyltransferase family 2 protein n=1 Tax=Burkholderia sp. WAC0059 TaxID=2066022 RepID=UPI000C7EF161|nr:glycosyltransferase family 2 protein [Burkholderia sp. WAC0059]PLZ00554.1 glycosyl transferase [Burkholderia sp. WAC0059]